MKLYTKGGDDGTTGIYGGLRVRKNDLRVHAYGEVDELNAVIGVATTLICEDDTAERFRTIQFELFMVGGELATEPGKAPPVAIAEAHAARLESWIDDACNQVPPLENFVLPGGSALAAHLHLARTVCRRAERAVAALAQRETIRAAILVYLNRLSDLLFAQARLANHRAGVADVTWSRRS